MTDFKGLPMSTSGEVGDDVSDRQVSSTALSQIFFLPLFERLFATFHL